MTAVEPTTSHLSPFVTELANDVRLAVADVVGIPPESLGLPERKGEQLSMRLQPHGSITLSNVSGPARRAGSPLTFRTQNVSASDRRHLARRLQAGDDADRPHALARLAAKVDAWWPFAALSDDEFRKVSSSPDGSYGTLRLGYRCNQDCWFCWQDRSAPMPPFERYITWLDELAAIGVGSINFTGGEVTTVPWLITLMERASKEHHLAVSIQTNAVRLARQEYLRTLIDAGLQAAMVSLHSADPAVSDRMTRAPGTHARTVAGIRAALEHGLVVTITCVVEAANVEGLVEHAELIIEHLNRTNPNNSIRRVTYAHPTDYFDPGRWTEQQVPFDQLRSNLSEAVGRLQSVGIPVQVGGSCGFPLCALDPTVAPQAYEVVTRDAYHPAELIHRRYGAACSQCSARSACFGLRQEYLDRFGERGLLPIKAAPSR